MANCLRYAGYWVTSGICSIRKSVLLHRMVFFMVFSSHIIILGLKHHTCEAINLRPRYRLLYKRSGSSKHRKLRSIIMLLT
jgi:hypothetical protein